MRFMVDNTSCKSFDQLPSINEFHSTSVDFVVVAKVLEKHPNVWVMEYLKSNVFWDETDQIAYTKKGEKLVIFRSNGDENIEVGQNVLMNLNQTLWPTYLTEKKEYCIYPFRIFSAQTIQPETFNWRISFISSLKQPLFIFLILFSFMFVRSVTIFFKRMKAKKF